MMQLTMYRELQEIIPKCRSRRQLKKCVGIMYPGIPIETLSSIYSQEFQRKTKHTFAKHNSEERRQLYYNMFFEKAERKEKHIIIDMARQFDITPCLLARILMDVYLSENEQPRSFDPNLPKRKMISYMFRYPYKLPNSSLATAVHEAVLADDMYGLYSDKIRRAVGLEFEQKLTKWCEEKQIEYMTEDELRKDGYDKTPDIKLVLPVAVDGFAVNWIESKAMFGDEECHTIHVKEQLGPYTHRFGPGLIIYWFGYVDALDCQRHKGIAIADSLPTKVEKIDLKLWEDNLDWEFPRAVGCEPSEHNF